MLGRFIKRLLGAREDVSAAPPVVDEEWLASTVRLHQQGAYADVITRCEAALARSPDDSTILNLLASALLAQGKAREGIAQLKRATALAPSPQSHSQLGAVLARIGDFDDAIAHYRAAIDLSTDYVDAWGTLGALYKTLGRYDEAEECCLKACELAPRDAGIRHVLASVLFEQARVDEAIGMVKQSLALNPADATVHSTLLRMLWYSDRYTPAEIFAQHKAWAARHEPRLAGSPPAHRNDRNPSRRLRVGFVSPYLHKHAVTFFLESIIEHHDRSALEIFLYADVARPDDYSRRLENFGAHWRSTIDLDHEALAQQVRDDAIDILVDLSGHTANNRLPAFAMKPAPIQVNWLGFPSTTGMQSMDYRITDAYCDPPGMTERFNSERLVRLPGIYMAWRAPDETPAVTPLPALTNGYVTFGTFHSAFKISPAMTRVWARLLNRVPNSRLRVLAVSGRSAERHLHELFAGCGIASEKLDIRPRLSFADYLAEFAAVDIALDTFPYHGATTTCFSLWMGLPVVVLEGTAHASRADVSMLTHVGLPELIAATDDQYVEIAAGLASDLDKLAQLRAKLRGMMQRSPLADGEACARNLERAFREMWTTWCAGTSASPAPRK